MLNIYARTFMTATGFNQTQPARHPGPETGKPAKVRNRFRLW